jgi:hypothetical protein
VAIVADDREAPDGVLQFSNVAGPRMLAEEPYHLRRERDLAAVFEVEAPQK